MSSKRRAGPIPTDEYRCECGGQRHKCDIERIAELGAEVARLKKEYAVNMENHMEWLEEAQAETKAAEAKLQAVGELPTHLAMGPYSSGLRGKRVVLKEELDALLKEGAL